MSQSHFKLQFYRVNDLQNDDLLLTVGVTLKFKACI